MYKPSLQVHLACEHGFAFPKIMLISSIKLLVDCFGFYKVTFALLLNLTVALYIVVITLKVCTWIFLIFGYVFGEVFNYIFVPVF